MSTRKPSQRKVSKSKAGKIRPDSESTNKRHQRGGEGSKHSRKRHDSNSGSSQRVKRKDEDLSQPQEARGQQSAQVNSVRMETVTEKNVQQRVDNYLLSVCKGVPKSKIYRVIRKGEVRINKKRCKPETKLMLGDVVRIPPMFNTKDVKGPVKLSDSLSIVLDKAVLYEDDQVLAINKPSGLAVHGGSGVNLGLIEALRTRYPEHQFLELVHRLDRDTSGVVLIAKSRPALRSLHAQFRDDTVNKTYHLAVYGKWPKHKTMVDAPLRKNELQSGERMVVVAADGKSSQTKFSILDRADAFTLVEAKPITGRTHQIRVHAAFSKHPIVGDSKYIQNLVDDLKGMEKARLMLHARAIEFDIPFGGEGVAQRKMKRMSLQAPYDKRYMEALSLMGLNADMGRV